MSATNHNWVVGEAVVVYRRGQHSSLRAHKISQVSAFGREVVADTTFNTDGSQWGRDRGVLRMLRATPRLLAQAALYDAQPAAMKHWETVAHQATNDKLPASQYDELTALVKAKLGEFAARANQGHSA